MDKSVDQCSAVKCTAAQPRLTKSSKEEEKSLFVFFCIGASISIGWEIRYLPYAGFFSHYKEFIFNILNNFKPIWTLLDHVRQFWRL